MGKVAGRILVVLALASGPVLPGRCLSTDIVFVAGYPVGPIFYMEEAGLEYRTAPLFWGVYLVTPVSFQGRASGPLLADLSILYWPAESLLVSHVDLGLGGDLWILHASIAVGVGLVQLSDPYYEGTVRTWGADMTIRVGLKLGPVIISTGLSAPLDVVGRFLTADFPIVRSTLDELQLFGGQLTAGIGYSF